MAPPPTPPPKPTEPLCGPVVAAVMLAGGNGWPPACCRLFIHDIIDFQASKRDDFPITINGATLPLICSIFNCFVRVAQVVHILTLSNAIGSLIPCRSRGRGTGTIRHSECGNRGRGGRLSASPWQIDFCTTSRQNPSNITCKSDSAQTST